MKYMVGLKSTDESFLEYIKENRRHIYEVYFSWGDIPNGRTSQLENDFYSPWNLQSIFERRTSLSGAD